MILLSILFGGALNAQNFNEWVRQKRTQRKYLLEQIVALQSYIEIARKGYRVMDEGLDLISSIRDGDWKQFIEYFGSLESINPAVRRYQRLKDIVAYNKHIVSLYSVIYRPAKASGKLTGLELKEADIRFDAVLKSSLLHLREADDLVTPGKLVMKDDERLKRIDYIYASMAANYSLAWHVCRQIVDVSYERQLTLEELELIKRMQ